MCYKNTTSSRASNRPRTAIGRSSDRGHHAGPSGVKLVHHTITTSDHLTHASSLALMSVVV
jgi:hypothetical protein